MKNNTVLGEKLQKALDESSNEIKNFVWKGPREEKERTQSSIRMIDASPEQLKDWYKHCQSMLYSEDKRNPG